MASPKSACEFQLNYAILMYSIYLLVGIFSSQVKFHDDTPKWLIQMSALTVASIATDFLNHDYSPNKMRWNAILVWHTENPNMVIGKSFTHA